MTGAVQSYDCGDCPLYGGCLRVCARSLERERPPAVRPLRDLFEAAELDGLGPCRGSDLPSHSFGRRPSGATREVSHEA